MELHFNFLLIMKKLFILLSAFMPFCVFGQTVNYIRQDTIKHIAKGNDTKYYHEGDSYKFETKKDSFDFNKPLRIEGAELLQFEQPIDSLSFKISNNPNLSFGKIEYDTNNKIGQFNLYDQNPNTSGQPMYEMWVPPSCYNGTASTIINGTPVYIDTTEQGYPSISPADNRYYTNSRAVGVATHDIAPYTFGTVTTFGLINNVPSMAGRESNDVFIGQNGGKVFVRPTGGAYPIKIGTALDDTTLLVYTCTSEYTDETIKANGFKDYSNTYTTISFNNSNRYAKIEPIGSEFYYYQYGTKYIQSEADSIQIGTNEGIYVVYYDTDTLNYAYNPNDSEIEELVKEKVTVMFIYWDATNSEGIAVGDERHTFHLEPYSRFLFDFVIKASYGGTGLNITNIAPDENGSNDTMAQFNITSGNLFNEDIYGITPSLQRGDTIPLYYLSGADNYLRRIYEYGFPVLTDITAGVGATGRLVYNNTATGTLATITNNDFVLCHIFAYIADNDSNKVFSVIGQNAYSSIANAQNGALIEGREIKSNNLFKREVVLLYSIIFQTSDVYANTVKARVVSALDELGNPVDFIDWRGQILGGGGSGGGAAGSFTDLTDSPSSYSGQASKLVSVNSGETALEFIPNVYEDSAGIVRVVDNSEFTDVVTDTLLTDNIKFKDEDVNIITDSLGFNGFYIQNFYQEISRHNTESITANASFQDIAFVSDLGTTDYTLSITAYDASGNIVFPTIGSKSSTGFQVQINIDCTIEYNAVINF